MSQEFIRGSQISLHFLRMFAQSLKEILVVSFIVLLIAISLYLYIKGDHYVLNVILLIKYLFANLLTIFKSTNPITFPDINGQILKAPADKYCNWYSNVILPQLLSTLYLAFISGLKWFFSCFGAIFMFFYYKGKKQTKNQYIRGIKLITPFRLKKEIVLYNLKHLNFDPYKIADLPYPKDANHQHTLITGAPGTGKTQIILDLLSQIRAKGDRAVIYDRTGTYVRKFYDQEKDIILNPFDQRGANWDIFHESSSKPDFDLIAASLIESSTHDPIWSIAARIVLSESCFLVSKEPNPSIERLCKILLEMPLHKLAKYLQTTPAGSIIDTTVDKNAAALSVRMVLSTYANCLKLIHNNQSDDFFSIRKWIQDSQQQNFLFLSSSATKYDSIKSLLSLWVDVAVREMLNLNQEEKRTIWFIIDELPSLQKLPSLKMALAESRQYGGAFVISMQLMSQMREVYGRDGAESISGLCRNRLTLATPDQDTARWCAENLGKKEIFNTKENISFGANTIRDGVSMSNNKEIETLVIPSEIMNLKNLEFYIKFSNGFDIAKSNIKYQERTDVAKKFIPKEERLEEQAQNKQQTQVSIDDLKQSKKYIKTTSKKSDYNSNEYDQFNSFEQANQQGQNNNQMIQPIISDQEFQKQLADNDLELEEDAFELEVDEIGIIEEMDRQNYEEDREDEANDEENSKPSEGQNNISNLI